MGTFTILMPEETALKLGELAEKLDRTQSSIALNAIEDFISRERYNIADIEAGLAEADVGDFASESDVAALRSKYNIANAI